MTVGGEDESKKYFRDRKIDLRDVTMKYNHLAIFIRHDSAEIWEGAWNQEKSESALDFQSQRNVSSVDQAYEVDLISLRAVFGRGRALLFLSSLASERPGVDTLSSRKMS
jgi:hypothetical protein